MAAQPSGNATIPQSLNPSDTAVLEALIPGYSFISRLAASYLRIDISYYVPYLLLAAVVAASMRFSFSRISNLLDDYFISTAEIRVDDEIYNYLMFWMTRQRFVKRTLHFVAATKTHASRYYDSDDSDSDTDEAGVGDSDLSDADTQRGKTDLTANFDDYWAKTIARDKYKRLRFTPAEGKHYFRFRGRILSFRREVENDYRSSYMLRPERLYLSCLGRDPTILKELLAEAQRCYVERDAAKMIIYRGQKDGSYFDWRRCMARSPRPLSTVVLDQMQKTAFVDDLKEYLHPRTRRWYSNRGIPYRRGYLLHGPPGTGKTSLCSAAAGLLGLKLYLLSLNSKSLDEDGLMSLFQDLPSRCIVLLEDVDSAGITKKREEESGSSAVAVAAENRRCEGKDPRKGGADEEEKKEKEGVTLSSLLNVIDGVAASEGRILVMTTNHAEKLDPALLRPGRVDMMVAFGYADSADIKELFTSIYMPLEGDLPAKSRMNGSAGSELQKETARSDNGRVAALATEFASLVPGGEVTAAEIQGYLLNHKDAPDAAVQGAGDWVDGVRKERAKKQANGK